MADYIYMMESRLSPAQLQVVGQVQDIARAHEMNVYLTGGAVRDIISGFAIRDLDFTVQGNVHKRRKDLEKVGAIIQGEDENLRILYVLFPNHVRTEIASARSERSSFSTHLAATLASTTRVRRSFIVAETAPRAPGE